MPRHIHRREICSIDPVPKRCLPIPNDNGHEHISLMPFFIVLTACWRLGGRKETYMDNVTENEVVKRLDRIASALEQIVELMNVQSNSGFLPEIPEQPKARKISHDEQQKDFIVNHLEMNGISITECNVSTPTEYLINMSVFMGEHFDYIQEFLKRIKQSINTKRLINWVIKDYPKEQITYLTQMGTNLSKCAFLSNYKYLKSPKFQIIGDTTNISTQAINFYNGQWLEIFVRQVIEKRLETIQNQIPTDYCWEVLNNIKFITNAMGKDYEIDFLVSVNNEIFWFEAKTGDYQNYMDRYSKTVRRILNLDKNHSFLVLSNEKRDVCTTLTDNWDMTVISIYDLQERINDIFGYSGMTQPMSD